jgi:2-polyprenyl-6-methoxyphenol hydroxylase-like FAD-dependent oxidoreductase
MARVRKALIVGGGIGGLCAAIALRRAGIDVDLVEMSREWTVYHVGIVVQGNAIRAMKALGIARECIAAGFPYDGLIFADLAGNTLVDIRGLPLAGADYPTDLGLTRPALHKALSGTVLELGTRVRLGMTYESFEQSADRVTVKFTDGTLDRYDLMIGADGCFSTVREKLYGARYVPQFTGQGVWRYNVPRPKELARAMMIMGLQGGKAGFIPLTPDTGYVLLVQAELGNPRLPDDRLAEIFRERLAPCTGVMARLRDQIVDPKLVVYRPLKAVFVDAPWYKGRVVLMGDAVHATTPHMGQGAAQAMEDAVVLGDVMARDAPINELLELYMQRRYERCKTVFHNSIQIGEWEQHPTPAADPAGLTQRTMQVLAQPI